MSRAHSGLTVVVVSDFEPGEKTWKNEEAMAEALARQDYAIDFDLIIVESESHRGRTPPSSIAAAFPGVNIVYHESERSAALKDYGVSLCATEWVAVLEADVLPEPDWLSHLMRAAAEHPDYDVFTGRTHYGTESSWQRALNLLDRSFDDLGASGPTQHISNNGAVYRTEMLKGFPYPDAATPFLSSRIRNETIFRSGHRAYFEREALVRHAVGGLGFVVDFRRHTGYADMMMEATPSLAAIPRRSLLRALADLRHVLRLHHRYWRWYDWPLGLGLYTFARVPELIGMVEALKARKVLAGSAYR